MRMRYTDTIIIKAISGLICTVAVATSFFTVFIYYFELISLIEFILLILCELVVGYVAASVVDYATDIDRRRNECQRKQD